MKIFFILSLNINKIENIYDAIDNYFIPVKLYVNNNYY